MSIRKNAKKQEITRVEAQERNVNLPKSAQECLEIAKAMLEYKGYKVKNLVPRKREHNGPGYVRPEVFVSPIEFSVNGMEVGLYGNILLIDGKVTWGNYSIYSPKQTFEFLRSKVRNRSETRERKVEPRLLSARFLAACFLG